jgi:putative permease
MPLGAAYIISLILSPIIPFLMKLGLSKGTSFLIVITFLVILIVIPLVSFIPNLNFELEAVKKYIPRAEKVLTENFELIREKVKTKVGYDIGTKYLEDSISWIKDGAKNFLLKVPNLIASLLEWILLVPLFAFFILRDGYKIKKGLLSLVPNAIFERTFHVLHEFHKKLGGYIFAKFVEALILGSIVFIGFIILDIRFPFLLGLLAGITNVVPYVGPIIGIIPGVIVCLVESGVGPDLWAALILYGIANFIDLGLVFPILVSKIVDLHPVVVVVSVIFGSQYMGILGMIISIPLAAVCKLLLTEFTNALYPKAFNSD